MEIWKSIKVKKGYLISNKGRVKSVDRTIVCKNRWGGKTNRMIKGKLISPLIDKQGYMSVRFGRNSKRYLVHRLVYETFVGDIPNGMQVNHKDEKKGNNNLDNLNLLTPKDNVNYGTGMERSSIKQGFKTYQYSLGGELIAVYNSAKKASKETGFDKNAILRHRLNGKQYKGYRWSDKPL